MYIPLPAEGTLLVDAHVEGLGADRALVVIGGGGVEKVSEREGGVVGAEVASDEGVEAGGVDVTVAQFLVESGVVGLAADYAS